MIGANGAGKSNFIAFFHLLKVLFNRNLQRYILEHGKADALLYYGSKHTEELAGEVLFAKNPAARENNAYRFKLKPTNEGGLYLRGEGSGYEVDFNDPEGNYNISQDLEESHIPVSNNFRDFYLKDYLAGLQIFHFHDTSYNAPLRKASDLEDNAYLKPDGGNLAAYLYFLKERHAPIFRRIEQTVKRVAPFLDHFILAPSRLNEGKIELRWSEAEDPESNFGPSQFSDGTLRFIALTTLLLQPDPPEIIIIDEPELGLHPQAIALLAGMIQSITSAQKSQVIVSTQSVNLLDHFQAEDIHCRRSQ